MISCMNKILMLSKLKILKYEFTTTTKTTTKIMTGIQPTGNLTIGNYIGSVLNLLSLQKKHQQSQIYLSIVDLHSLTTAFQVQHSNIKYEAKIGENTIGIAKTLIAAGIYSSNKSNVKLFVQSQVKEHAELCWILGCIGPQNWLNMMIQYKQKSSQNSSLGIYAYPVLMTADILLYRANLVPVGQDQKQHLQLAKRYAERFNSIVKQQYFPMPECILSETSRVMSLTDPEKKMSKSDANDRSRINLSDTKDLISIKIKKATTDAQGSSITYDPENRKGLANLLKIYGSLSNRSIDQILKQFQGSGIKQLKQKLIEILWLKLSQIQYNIKNLSDQQAKNILKIGQDQARKVAKQTVGEIKTLLKLYKQ